MISLGTGWVRLGGLEGLTGRWSQPAAAAAALAFLAARFRADLEGVVGTDVSFSGLSVLVKGVAESILQGGVGAVGVSDLEMALRPGEG